MVLKLLFKILYLSLKRYFRKDIQDFLQWLFGSMRNLNAQGEVHKISRNVPGTLEDEVFV